MIASVRNPRVVHAAGLRLRQHRRTSGEFLVEGPLALAAALAAGARVAQVFHLAELGGAAQAAVALATAAGARVEAVTRPVLERLASTVTPQGVVAVVGVVDGGLGDLDPERGPVPVLVQVRDPGNAGAIIRSADAAGAGGVVLTRGSVDPYNPKAVRATAGSIFHVPVVRDVEAADAIEHLRERGCLVLAAAADGEVSLDDADLTGPAAIVFGNEAHGLPPEVRAAADAVVRVPIQGRAESLNLAAAAGVVLFEAARQRRAASNDG